MKRYLITHSVETSQRLDATQRQLGNQDEETLCEADVPEPLVGDGAIDELIIDEQIQYEIANGDRELAREVADIANDSSDVVPPNDADEIISYIIRKSNSCYLTIQYPRLVFLDILMFLCVGTNLEKYMKCFDKSASKMNFPYEWLTDSSKLIQTSLPPREAFYNRLKNTHISHDDYQRCLAIWRAEGCVTFEDYLKVYNISDIRDLPHCTEEHAKFFKTLKIDLWKDGLSLPGLSMAYMFKTIPRGLNFVLVDRWNASFYWKLRRATQGGLSIVINREMVANKTLIRNEPNGKLCKRVISLDCNALYLGCLTKPMPVHHFCTYRYPNFKREKSFEFGILALEWMCCYAKKNNVSIQHEFNSPNEFRVNGYGVDGYISTQKTILQFHGCYWHSCVVVGCKYSSRGKKNTKESVKKLINERYEKTVARTAELRDLGFVVIEIWEHEWRVARMSTENQLIIESLFYRDEFHPRGPLTQEKIIEMIQNGTIFGFVEVDMHCPDSLKSKFADFQPFYKNASVSIDDIGDHMREFAKSNGLMKQPIKCLLLSYFTQKSMLLTPLVQWYLQQGMVIDRVHTLYSFKSDVCFTKFVNQVVTARRNGDKNPNQKIISEFFKLLGNSSIGKSLLVKDKNKNIIIGDDKKVDRCINDSRFDASDELDANVFEIAMRKKTTKHNVPLTLGCVVYSLSKLEMLKFIYDFIYVYFSKSDVCILNSDTDSIWLGLSGENLDDLVRPALRRQYFENYHKTMPSLACVNHRSLFVERKMLNESWCMEDYECCVAYNKEEQRTPLLFKYEFQGKFLYALTCKTYHAGSFEDDSFKQSTKGISKRHSNLQAKDFVSVLDDDGHNPKKGINLSFVTKNSEIYTYKQERVGLSYLYYKRKVCSDGKRTEPTDL